MALASNDATGLVGLANDLQNLMAGGGTMQLRDAAELLRVAGFTEVTPLKLPSGALVHGRAA
jgi:hypothetical protein